MSNLRRAFAFFWPDKRAIVIVLLVLLGSLGLNVLKPWPLAYIVDGVLGDKPLPGWLPDAGKTQQLARLLLAMLGLYVGQALLSATQNYLAISIGLRGLNRVRNQVFSWLQRLSLRFYHGSQVGDLTYRATTDTYAFQTLFQQGFVALTSSALALLFIVGIMWTVNRPLTFLAVGMVPLVVLSIRYSGRRMQQRGAEAQKAESRLMTFIQQGILALPLVQSYTRESDENARFQKQTAWSRQKKMSQHGWEVFYGLMVSLCLGIGIVALTWLGARQVMAGQLTVGELLVFLAYLAQMFEPLNQLTYVGSTVASAAAGIDRVFEILNAPDDVKESAQPRPVVREQDVPKPADTVVARGNLAFEEVSFSYQPGLAVLRQVTFQVRAGQSVAIIGPSGSGKSTLLNLIPRFFDPTSGVVRLEGVNLRDLRLHDLRTQVALLLQEPIILPATVAENISYGKPAATWAQIEEAARAASATQFIEKLPQKYETVIGETGIGLSVGEKQRINLARAFLKEAPILLLDEPTSALDAESEELVVHSLGCLMTTRTTIIIAHRLTTIRQVDCIIVLEEGRVTAVGSPQEVALQKGYYARVLEGQAELG